jgi:alkaline phosphatase
VFRPSWSSLLVGIACGVSVACNGTATKAPVSSASAPERPRNIVLVIGDGMGPQQIGLLGLYARKAPSGAYGDGPTAFQRLARNGESGLSWHDPADTLVTDSACSATQLALGRPSIPEAVGVDAAGEPQPTLLEASRDAGWATGLVSDTRVTHATPAAFASHVPHRDDENTIAVQMLETGPDVMLSGGWRHFLPQGAEGSRRTDDRDLLKDAESAGYDVVRDRAALAAAGDRVLGVFAPSGMLDAITERATRDDPDRTEPSLAEMATAALDRLERRAEQDDSGFFLMLEAGQVDWSCHANDAGWLLHEMLRADETIHAVLDWVEGDADRADTLVVVTADHETGGFGLAYSRADLPEPVDLPGAAFDGVPFEPGQNYGGPALLDALATQSATTHSVLGGLRAEAPEDPAARDAWRAGLPDALVERWNAVSAFPIDRADAVAILADQPDPYPRDATDRDVPRFDDFAAFYPPLEYGRSSLINRRIADQQNVVWATGGHTHTPVPVFAVGPGAVGFDGLQHHVDIGARLMGFVR